MVDNDDMMSFLTECRPPFCMGIDPGATGGIGFVSECDEGFAMDIPVSVVKRKGGTKTVADYQGIIELFRRIYEYHQPCDIKVCLEEAVVQIKGKGANAYTGFRVGCFYSMWPLFLLNQGHSLLEVHPRSWKGSMKILNMEKEQVRRKAAALFPDASLKRKMDHNRAEALMLALYRKTVIG